MAYGAFGLAPPWLFSDAVSRKPGAVEYATRLERAPLHPDSEAASAMLLAVARVLVESRCTVVPQTLMRIGLRGLYPQAVLRRVTELTRLKLGSHEASTAEVSPMTPEKYKR